MKIYKKYDIDIFMLNNGTHEYEFEINKEFFELFENSLLENGSGKVQVELDKSETMIQMKIHSKGEVELICDRTLENFDEPFEISSKVIFKYGEENMEIDDDIYMIEKNTQKINIAQIIYDYISLTIPMKKLHPSLRDEEDDLNEENYIEGKLVYSSTDPVDEESADNLLNKEESDKNEDIDPRWNVLKKLKDNNNN
jgi:uncharacterized protein